MFVRARLRRGQTPAQDSAAMSDFDPDRAGRHAELDETTVARWQRFARGDTTIFPNHLGFVVEEVREDYCRMRLPNRTEMLQGAGIMHGGAIAALLDGVLVPAVGAVLPKGARYSTVDLHVQFIRAIPGTSRDGGPGEDALAEGWVTRRGRTTAFCESEVYSADSGALVAKGVATYNITLPS